MAIKEETKIRMAEVASELIKRFQSAGFTTTEYNFSGWGGEFSVNHKAVVIDSKRDRQSWRSSDTGKLFVKFDGADYKAKLFHEKQGQIDYDKIISEFVEEQKLANKREESQTKEAEKRNRIKAFIADNRISDRIGVYPSELRISIRCLNEEELYKLLLILNEAV